MAPLLATSMLAFIAYLVFTPHYAGNDDVGMRLMAEGRFVPDARPLPYLLSINVILGVSLARAYTVMPGVPWYDLLMGLTTFISAAVMMFIWGGAGSTRTLWSVLLGAFFLLPIFVGQQFTQAAMLSAAAGVSLLARAVCEPLTGRSRHAHLWFGPALFVWGGLIRFEGAALIALAAAAFIIPLAVACWKDRSTRGRLFSPAVAASAGVVLLSLCFLFNLAVYTRAGSWGNFPEFNWLRSELTEYLPGGMTTEEASVLKERVGWSRNDLSMLQNWFFTDTELFSIPKLQQAVEVVHSGRGTLTTRPGIGPRQAIESLRQFFIRNQRSVMWAFLIMAGFALACGGRRAGLGLFFLWTSGVFVLVTLLGSVTFKELPYRVFWPIFILQTAFLAVAASRWGRPPRRAFGLPVFVCAVMVTAITFRSQLRESAEFRERFAAATQEMSDLTNSRADLYVLHGGDFPYELIWRPFHSEHRRFPFLPLGTTGQTPPVQDFLRRTGRLNLPLAICSEPGILLVSSPSFLPVLSEFVREHDDRQVEFQRALGTTSFSAWRCNVSPRPVGELSQAQNK
jgi:hypothetical protein